MTYQYLKNKIRVKKVEMRSRLVLQILQVKKGLHSTLKRERLMKIQMLGDSRIFLLLKAAN